MSEESQNPAANIRNEDLSLSEFVKGTEDAQAPAKANVANIVSELREQEEPIKAALSAAEEELRVSPRGE